MFKKSKDKFYKGLYKLDKSLNDDEGKNTPDFDTWMKDLKEEHNEQYFSKKKKSKGKNTKKEDKSYKKNLELVTNRDNTKENQKNLKDTSKKLDYKKLSNKSYKIDEKNKKILKKQDLKKAVIYAEILAKPKSKR